MIQPEWFDKGTQHAYLKRFSFSASASSPRQLLRCSDLVVQRARISLKQNEGEIDSGALGD